MVAIQRIRCWLCAALMLTCILNVLAHAAAEPPAADNEADNSTASPQIHYKYLTPLVGTDIGLFVVIFVGLFIASGAGVGGGKLPDTQRASSQHVRMHSHQRAHTTLTLPARQRSHLASRMQTCFPLLGLLALKQLLTMRSALDAQRSSCLRLCVLVLCCCCAGSTLMQRSQHQLLLLCVEETAAAAPVAGTARHPALRMSAGAQSNLVSPSHCTAATCQPPLRTASC